MENDKLTPPPLSSNKKLTLIIGIAILLFALSAVAIAAFLVLNKDEDETQDAANRMAKNTKTTATTTITSPQEDMIYKKETASLPSWVKNDPMKSNEGPWFESLYIAKSDDGLNFSGEKLFLEHSGVANLIMTKDKKLIATFQYFSYKNEEMFDVIAYATSDDFGKKWSPVRKIMIKDTGEGANPVDPTLVELDEGRFRLYFTFQQRGEKYPQLFSAIGDSMSSEFLSEGQQLSTDEIVLDPAVVYFKGKWHHYTIKQEENLESEPSPNPMGIHSTSKTGLNFKLEEEIDIGMRFLGDVIEDDGGLRFYNGMDSAFSNDGYNWTKDDGTRVDGADPGVVKLPDGTYLMIYTRMNK